MPVGPEHAIGAEHLVGKRQVAFSISVTPLPRSDLLTLAMRKRFVDTLSPPCLVGKNEARLINHLSAIRDRDRKPRYALILQECHRDVCHRRALGGCNGGGRLRAGRRDGTPPATAKASMPPIRSRRAMAIHPPCPHSIRHLSRAVTKRSRHPALSALAKRDPVGLNIRYQKRRHGNRVAEERKF